MFPYHPSSLTLLIVLLTPFYKHLINTGVAKGITKNCAVHIYATIHGSSTVSYFSKMV